jgi:hypothetical protein
MIWLVVYDMSGIILLDGKKKLLTQPNIKSKLYLTYNK